MLRQLNDLAKAQETFAFETTLASRSFAPWLRRQQARGYRVHLVFLWLPSAEFAIQRVKERVRLGGHFVPDETVRRRYETGLRNFFALYRLVIDSWAFYSSANGAAPKLIASGARETPQRVDNSELWEEIKRVYGRQY